MKVETNPVDEHSCKLKFGSWTYDLSGIRLIKKNIVKDKPIENKNWIMESNLKNILDFKYRNTPLLVYVIYIE